MQPSSARTFLIVALCSSACGFSESINSSVRDQERQFQVDASKLMIQQTELIIASVQARATMVQPQTTARCEQIPMTECTVCYLSSPTEQSLELKTPACSIDAPDQAKNVDLVLSLRDLSLAATQTAATKVTLRGQGHLDLTAQLPLLGAYRGAASYVIRSGSVDTATWAVVLDLLLTYQSGQNTPVEVTVQISGSPTQLTGQVRGPLLACQVSGTLKVPAISCR